MKKIISKSLEETQKLAHEWVSSLDTSRDEALVVGLYGNLGAGKTAFTQAVARELGIKETVTSPTFVIEKKYEIEHSHFARLIHIDAYRLESAKELEVLNFEEIIANKNNLILIEWPENVKEAMPEDHIRINFTFVDETTRSIDIISVV